MNLAVHIWKWITCYDDIMNHIDCVIKRRGPTWLSGKVFYSLFRGPGLSLTGSSGFFRGSVLGQETSEPSLVLVKPRKA